MKALLLNILNSFNLFQIFNRYTANTAAIFMLHRIDSLEKETEGGLSPAILRQYFEYLKNQNYEVISLSSFIDALKNGKETYKSVIFTVDDGYRDFYLNAYEIFKEYGYPATIFITSDFIEGELFFWWDKIEYIISQSVKEEINLKSSSIGRFSIKNATEKNAAISTITNHCKNLKNDDKLALIQKLQVHMDVDISGQPKDEYTPLEWNDIYEMKNNGIEFYPHTKTHPIMSKIPHEQKIEELAIPKKIIEDKLKTTADIFCYPNGGLNDFDEETISVLKSLDYSAAVTGIPGLSNTKEMTDFFRISRFALPYDEIIFKQYVSGLENFKRSVLGNLLKKYN